MGILAYISQTIQNDKYNRKRYETIILDGTCFTQDKLQKTYNITHQFIPEFLKENISYVL